MTIFDIVTRSCLQSNKTQNFASSVNKIESSQEKTVIDFIHVPRYEVIQNTKFSEVMHINNNTFTTTETFEPSVADEIEYNPHLNQTDETIEGCDFNEGMDEGSKVISSIPNYENTAYIRPFKHINTLNQKRSQKLPSKKVLSLL